jgi:glyoxylase-like metal-dependent hydrolase (beta-lactamase superfamily II)
MIQIEDRFVETDHGFFIKGIHTGSFWENLHGGTVSSVTFIESQGKAALIDAGAGEDLCEFIIKKIRERNVELLYLILTHDHYDHVENGQQIVNEFACQVIAHPLDKPLIENPMIIYDNEKMETIYGKDLSMVREELNALPEWGWKQKLIMKLCYNFPLKVDQSVQEGDVIEIGDVRLEVYHTPGHSPGSITLFDRSSGLIHVGDVDYWFNPTRPYPIGNAKDLFHSLEKVKQIPATTLYRGHHEVIQGRNEIHDYLNSSLKIARTVEKNILAQLNKHPQGLTILDLVNNMEPVEPSKSEYYLYNTGHKYFRSLSGVEAQTHAFLTKLRGEKKVDSLNHQGKHIWRLN